MQKVVAYKTLSGTYEEDLDRAIAWDLVKITKDMNPSRGELLSFSAALWVVNNFALIKEIMENSQS